MPKRLACPAILLAELPDSAAARLSLLLPPRSGTIPETWGGWPKLFVLWMPGNQLSGPLPAAIGRNPQMQYLYLHNNRLERPLAGWGVWSSLANLRDLFLDINRLSGPLDMPFSSWPKLAVRAAAACSQHAHCSRPSVLPLTGWRPSCRLPFCAHQELGLGDNQLTGDLTPAIAAMRGLPMKRLFLGPNNFSSVVRTRTRADRAGA